MSTEAHKAQLDVGVDASKAKEGFADVTAAANAMASKVVEAGKKAADGVDKIGESSEEPAAKIDKSSRSMIASIQRTTAAMEAGSKSGAEYYRALAAQRGVSLDVLKPYLDQLDAVTAKQVQATSAIASGTASMTGLGVSAKQTAAAMRGIPAQFTDIVVSLSSGQAPMTVLLQQGGQLKDMFGGVGNAARALGTYIAGLVSPITVLAAAAAALAFAYAKGAAESENYAKALILSGNAAGSTSGDLGRMAASISKVTGTQSAAAAALAEMAQSSGVGRNNLEDFTRAAIKFEAVTGTAVSETVKQFQELAKSPLEASIKLNSQYNYLTESVYKQIKSLEEQGKTTEAANVAQKALADTLEVKTAQMVQSLGVLEKAWMSVKSAIAGTWDAAKGIGRPVTVESQIAALESQISGASQLGSLARSRGMAVGGGQSPELLSMQAQLSTLKGIANQQSEIARQDAERKTKLEAIDKFNKDESKYLSDKVKMQREISAVEELGRRGEIDSLLIQQRIAAIRESYAKKGPKEKGGDPFAADREFAKEYAKTWEDFNKIADDAEAKTDGLSKAQARLLQYLSSPAYAAHSEAMRQEVLTQAYAAINTEQHAEALKREAKEADEAAKAHDALFEAQIKQADTLRDQVTKQLEHNAALGLSKEAIAALEVAKLQEQATAKDGLATTLEENKLNTELAKLYREQAKSLRELADAKVNGAIRETAVEEAKKSEQAWTKFYDSLYNGLTDSLYRAFEKGKGFFQSLWDGIKNLFKTTVLKLVIQGVVGSVLGAAGLPGAAQAQGSTGFGNLMSIGQNASNLWSIGSQYAAGTMSGANAAGTIFANATGGGIDALLATNGAYGTAGASSAASSFAAAAPPVAAMIAAYMAINAIDPGPPDGFRNGGGYTMGTDGKSTLTQSKYLGRGQVAYSANGYEGGSIEYVDQKTPLGGQLVDDQVRAVTDATTANINGYLKRFGSALQLTEYASGLASSNTGDSMIYAGGKIGGKSFGRSETDPSANLGTNLTDAEALKAYGLQLDHTVLQALQTANLGGAIGDYVDSLHDVDNMTAEATTAVLQQIAAYDAYTQALSNTPFESLRNLSVEAANALTEAAGGLQNLTTGLQSYYASYYTDAERAASSTNALSTQFQELGLALPATRAEFRQLVEAQDLTTEAGRRNYTTLIQLAGAYSNVAGAEESRLATLKGWQDQLDLLTGKTTDQELALRRDLASTTDESTKAIIRQVYAERARQTAIAEAEAARQKAISEAKTVFDRAVEAERTRINTIIDTRTAAQQSIQAVFDLLTSSVRDLYNQVDTTAAQSAQQGRAYITTALALAQAGGITPDQSKLQEAINASVGGINSTVYSSKFDQDRARLQLAGELAQLKEKTGDQLTTSELALQVAKEQLAALEDSAKQMDDLITATNGVDASVKSVAEAIAALAEVLTPKTAAIATKTTTASSSGSGIDTTQMGPSGSSYVGSKEPVNWSNVDSALTRLDFSGDNKVNAAYSLYAIAGSAGATQEDLAARYGYPIEDVRALFRGAGIGSFAVGTNYVPRDMLAQIHEGEAIVPKAFNPWANGANPQSTTVVVDTKALEALVTMLIQRQDLVIENTAVTANALGSGQPMLVEVAA